MRQASVEALVVSCIDPIGKVRDIQHARSCIKNRQTTEQQPNESNDSAARCVRGSTEIGPDIEPVRYQLTLALGKDEWHRSLKMWRPLVNQGRFLE